MTVTVCWLWTILFFSPSTCCNYPSGRKLTTADRYGEKWPVKLLGVDLVGSGRRHLDRLGAFITCAPHGEPGNAGRAGRPAGDAGWAPTAGGCDRNVSFAGHPGARQKNSLSVSNRRFVWPVYRHRKPRVLAWWLFGKRSAGFSLSTGVMEDFFHRAVFFWEIV